MALVPSTPQRVTGAVKTATPRTALKPRGPLRKTIHLYDANSSYIEDDDATYIHDTLDEELEEEYSVIEDLMIQVNDANETVLLPPQSAVAKFIMKHELGRKGLHSFIGVFTLKMYTMGLSTKDFIIPLVILFAVVFTNDFIRLRNPELNKKICRSMWWMIREKEVELYNGTLWYLAGLIIVFILFPKDISLMLVLLLLWADTAALTVGRAFGKYTAKILANKLVAGSFGAFLAGVASCFVLYGYFIPEYPQVNHTGDIMWSAESSKMTLVQYAVALGIIALGSELVDFMGIDDNFSIPVISAVALYILVRAVEQ